MNPAHIADFIGKEENCSCAFACAHEVIERFRGELVWKGLVWTFDLQNGPAPACYAWIDGDSQQLVTALKIPPVVSPELAIRAYIATSQAPR